MVDWHSFFQWKIILNDLKPKDTCNYNRGTLIFKTVPIDESLWDSFILSSIAACIPQALKWGYVESYAVRFLLWRFCVDAAIFLNFLHDPNSISIKIFYNGRSRSIFFRRLPILNATEDFFSNQSLPCLIHVSRFTKENLCRYSQTCPQWPPWGQRKMALVVRWSLVRVQLWLPKRPSILCKNRIVTPIFYCLFGYIHK